MRILALISMAIFFSCAGQNGLVHIDGTIDPMEESLIRLSADAALTAKPDMLKPVYDVTGAMLVKMNPTAYTDGLIAELIRSEAIAAGIMPAEAETLVSMAYMMRAAIIAKIGEEKAALVLGKGVLIYEIVRIIHEQAGRRMST